LRDSSKQARFAAPIFLIGFLAALAAGAVAAPYRLAAPEPVPTVQPQPASQTGNAAKPEAADSQEEQNKAFRQGGPIVKWTAKTFHLSLEATASIFTFINFAIIALAIVIPLFRILPKFLRNRAEKVRTDIESARKVTEDANSRLSAVEAKLSSIGEEIEKFKTEVERESVEDQARIQAALKEESARILAAAEQEIASAAAQARRGLRSFAADLAIGQAAKQLVLTPEADRALIAEFVSDVTGNGRNKGGQN
jgi:F-type H+-transporting ATPase subunit b